MTRASTIKEWRRFCLYISAEDGAYKPGYGSWESDFEDCQRDAKAGVEHAQRMILDFIAYLITK